MEILQAPQLVVPIVYTGTNSIGPKLTITWPRVMIVPAKALSLIDDKLGEIEIDGEPLADPVTLSFGTVTVDGDGPSPLLSNVRVGMGTLTVDGNLVGNVLKLEFTPEVKALDRWNFQGAIKFKEGKFVHEVSSKLTFMTDEWSSPNLKYFLLAQ